MIYFMLMKLCSKQFFQVLASCSEYFYAMFTGFEESRQDKINIQGVDYQALNLLVEYMYTSNIYITEENVQILLQAVIFSP